MKGSGVTYIMVEWKFQIYYVGDFDIRGRQIAIHKFNNVLMYYDTKEIINIDSLGIELFFFC